MAGEDIYTLERLVEYDWRAKDDAKFVIEKRLAKERVMTNVIEETQDENLEEDALRELCGSCLTRTLH
jgi:hypothetical protein